MCTLPICSKWAHSPSSLSHRFYNMYTSFNIGVCEVFRDADNWEEDNIHIVTKMLMLTTNNDDEERGESTEMVMEMGCYNDDDGKQ